MSGLRIKTSMSALVALFFLVASFNLLPERAFADQRFSTETLVATTKSGATHSFIIELATNDAQREQGLMFRKSMAADAGMLFDFGMDRDVAMWMKNTFIPLDMLFLSKTGKVTHIAHDAVPHSEAIISSRGPVRFVLELNAGTAKKLGLSVGDRIVSPQIAKAQ